MKRKPLFSTVGLLLVLLLASMPAAAQQAYVVQPGDTLFSIAQKYDITTTALAAYNNITNLNLLFAGTTIQIPPASGTPGGSTGGTGTPSSTTIRYVVKVGDTLSSIAVRYNTTVQALKNANGLTASVIYPNQGLWVTPGTESAPVYVPPAPAPVQTGQYYWVQPGDNLFAIGLRFGANIYRIAEANGILNLNRIYAGVPLYIPR